MAEIQGLSHVPAGLASCDKVSKKNDFKYVQNIKFWASLATATQIWPLKFFKVSHVPTWLAEIEISSMWSLVTALAELIKIVQYIVK